MSKNDNLIVSVANPEAGQGKSSFAWALLSRWAVQGLNPVGIDADLINPETGEPTISGFVHPSRFTGFQVFTPDQVSPDIFERNVVIDGSKRPSDQVKALMASRSHVVMIIVRSMRGYEAAVSYARELFRNDVSFCFVLNGFSGDKAKKINSMLEAFDNPPSFDLGDSLSGIQDVTSNGHTQYTLDENSVMADAVERVSDRLIEWVNNTARPAKKAKLEAVKNG